MDDVTLYEEILRLAKSRTPAALVTIVETRGSTPRKPGAKMLVRQDRSILGTIGGGRWEASAIAAACEAMITGRTKTLRFSLTEPQGAACGGAFMVAIDPLVIAPQLFILGAGHVGAAVATAASKVGFLSQVLDVRQRATAAGDLSDPVAADRFHDDLLATFAIDRTSYLFIATSDHQSDFFIAMSALKTTAGYIGLLGSKKKRQALETFLRDHGLDSGTLARIICPAGLDIGAESPEEIALSVVAQLVAWRRTKSEDTFSPGP